MIKVISFDLDGTLSDLNFDKLIWNTEIPKLYSEKHNVSLEEAKNKVFFEYNDDIGHHRWTDISYWFEKFGLDDYNKLLEDVKHNIKIFPEVIPILKELKEKYKLIIITQSEKRLLDIKLKAENLGEFFSETFSTPSDFKKLEKDDEIYNKIMEKLKIKPEEMIHIGDDHDFDYLIPKSLGIRSFFLDRSKEQEGEYIVHNLEEFKEKIKC